MNSQPKTPEERGAWPESVGLQYFEDPVKVSIKFERPVYEWLAAYLESEEGNTSFTSSVEQTLTTLIRAMAGDGIDLDFVKDELSPTTFKREIQWRHSEN